MKAKAIMEKAEEQVKSWLSDERQVLLRIRQAECARDARAAQIARNYATQTTDPREKVVAEKIAKDIEGLG